MAMKCGVCGGENMAHDVRDLDHTNKDKSVVIRCVEGDYCPDCGEVVMTMPQAQYYSDAISGIAI